MIKALEGLEGLLQHGPPIAHFYIGHQYFYFRSQLGGILPNYLFVVRHQRIRQVKVSYM